MYNCNKYHLGGVAQGSINLTNAYNGGYLAAALVAMGFNYKNSTEWNAKNQEILYTLGRGAQIKFNSDFRTIATNPDLLTSQFQVMNQALGLNETNPYVLTAVQLKNSFLEHGLNINNLSDRDTWLKVTAPQFHQYIDMEPTKKVLDSILIPMSVTPENAKPITDQRPGPAGQEKGTSTEPMTMGAKVLWGLAALAGGVLLYNALSDDKPKYKGPALKGVKSHSKKSTSSASKPKVVQAITL